MKPQPQRTIWADGSQEWRINNQLHRTDGPAWIGSDGAEEWWVNGQPHRLDGPAVISADGDQEWFINGEDITVQVLTWQQQQGVVWPWDRQTQVLFQLTFL